MALNCIFLVFLMQLRSLSIAEKIQYISTEHPELTYVNPKYFSYANFTSQRYGRSDPFYYVGIHVYLLQAISNNVTWLTNVYKRSFVEMHFEFCNLIHNDKFFGSAMKQGKLAQPCPYPPGQYNLYNMSIPVKHIPSHFPFKKGRIYANVSATVTNEMMLRGYIDMEIKEYSRKKPEKMKIVRF